MGHPRRMPGMPLGHPRRMPGMPLGHLDSGVRRAPPAACPERTALAYEIRTDTSVRKPRTYQMALHASIRCQRSQNSTLHSNERGNKRIPKNQAPSSTARC